MHSHRTKDFWAGAIYVALGGATILLARDLPMGTSARMGAGYFPVVLSGLLILIGAISIARAFLRPGELVERIHLRPALFVIGATCIFAATLEWLGLVVALPVCILIAAAGSRGFRLNLATLAATAGLTAFCALVFIRGLGVPMPMFGTLFGG